MAPYIEISCDGLVLWSGGPEWVHHLMLVPPGQCTTPKEVQNISSADMVYGQALVVPG